MCNRAATFCALVEQEHPGVWRWAVYGVEDIARREGLAPTQAAARCAAVKALIALDQQGVIDVPGLEIDVPPISSGSPA